MAALQRTEKNVNGWNALPVDLQAEVLRRAVYSVIEACGGAFEALDSVPLVLNRLHLVCKAFRRMVRNSGVVFWSFESLQGSAIKTFQDHIACQAPVKHAYVRVGKPVSESSLEAILLTLVG